MPLRLGDYVVAGELINRRPNMTHGWLALRGEETPVIFQLTGNCSPELQGKHLRFSLPEDRPAPDVPPLDMKRLASQQVGPTGLIELRQLAGGAQSGRARSSGGAATCLYMEWFSQNGQVVLEVIEPELEWVDEDEDDHRRATHGAEASGDAATDEGDTDIFVSDSDGAEEAQYDAFEVPPPDADEDADDPYGLFPPGLDEELAEDDEPSLAAQDTAGGATSPSGGKRSWDEVVPGIDPETKKMYEDWDEVTEGTQDVPFTEVFDPPLKVYTPEQLDGLDDAAIEAGLKELLARLALLGVAVAMCEHFSAKLTYRMIAHEILPRYGVHPRLPQIGWVQHYDTSEFCRKCQEEFDRRYEEESRLREERGGEDVPPV